VRKHRAAVIAASLVVLALLAGIAGTTWELIRAQRARADAIVAALREKPVADPETQAACLKLAATWPESADECNNAGWALVSKPGQPDAIYRRGLRLARAASRIEPENVASLNTLGVAQYRCGLISEALTTLARSNERNQGREPSDLAFLALVEHRLGHLEEAGDTLRRLRDRVKSPQWAGDRESRAFLREAETIEFDRGFPAHPFAP
jgi:hypothetical protein